MRSGPRPEPLLEEIPRTRMEEALQGGGGIGGGTVHQFLGTDGRHRTGEVALALDAVADDHGLIQEFGIFLQEEVDDRLVAHLGDLAGIADAGDLDGGAGGHVQPVGTVRARDGADGRVADHHDGGSDDRSARGIDDSAVDGLVLRERRLGQKGDEKRDDSRHFQQCISHHMIHVIHCSEGLTVTIRGSA